MVDEYWAVDDVDGKHLDVGAVREAREEDYIYEGSS